MIQFIAGAIFGGIVAVGLMWISDDDDWPDNWEDDE